MGIPNVDQLRRLATKVPVDKVGRQTLRNIELGLGCSLETFAYLPQIYRMSYEDLLEAMWPEYELKKQRAEALFGSIPWLNAVVEKLAAASPKLQKAIERVLDVERQPVERA